jgi:hypothetical protein
LSYPMLFQDSSMQWIQIVWPVIYKNPPYLFSPVFRLPASIESG